jgi:hypothetical protein
MLKLFRMTPTFTLWSRTLLVTLFSKIVEQCLVLYLDNNHVVQILDFTKLRAWTTYCITISKPSDSLLEAKFSLCMGQYKIFHLRINYFILAHKLWCAPNIVAATLVQKLIHFIVHLIPFKNKPTSSPLVVAGKRRISSSMPVSFEQHILYMK